MSNNVGIPMSYASALRNPLENTVINHADQVLSFDLDSVTSEVVVTTAQSNVLENKRIKAAETSIENVCVMPIINNPHSTYITTLVFFDLESTGLGCFVGNSNVQITEVSMIAVDRKEFMKSQYPDLRDIRITHKLSMCIKPRCQVSPGAAKLTGLDNLNLSDQQGFDQNTAVAILSFLSHLQKPVCLLAHNGNAFDFPLLKAEFQRLNISVPSEIHTADTLSGFKAIGARDLPMGPKTPKSVKCKDGTLSLSLGSLHVYFFNKKHPGNHSSEGDCIALAKICHKMKEQILPWIDQNCKNLDSVQPMW